MEDDACLGTAAAFPWHRDFHRPGSAGGQTEEACRGEMGSSRSVARPEYRRHQRLAGCGRGAGEPIDAGIADLPSAGCEAPVDHALGGPELEDLTSGEDTVLPGSQLTDRSFRATWTLVFVVHVTGKRPDP